VTRPNRQPIRLSSASANAILLKTWENFCDLSHETMGSELGTHGTPGLRRAPAGERNALRIDQGQRFGEVDYRLDDNFPVGSQWNAALIQHSALAGAGNSRL
jgi:hypothetical protein